MEGLDNHEDHFSVEAIDSRCEKWMSMSSEEKQAFVDERKKLSNVVCMVCTECTDILVLDNNQ